MFNVKHAVIRDVLSWLEEDPGSEAIAKLERFGAWLVEEALPAGALGPQESERIASRHVAESLAFGCGIDGHAASVLDAGTGAGLPGIPLAILRPGTGFVLLDRSGRRIDLVSRALRVLDISNASAVQAEIREVRETYDGFVMRATIPPEAALPHIARLLRPGGRAVVGLSRRNVAPDVAALVERADRVGLELAVSVVPVLDSPTSLLRMTRNDHDS